MGRLRDHADPEEYFWARVEKGLDCWNWTGGVNGKGYGWFKSGQRAHRVSWLMHNGEIPEGMMVCHSCDNPRCVRPSHLFLGTGRENIADMIAKGRRRVEARGELAPHAKLTNAQAGAIRDEYARGGVGQRLLARKYRVPRATVQRIVECQSYVMGVAL